MTNLRVLLFVLTAFGSSIVDVKAFHFGGPFRGINERTILANPGRLSFASSHLAAVTDGAPQVPRPRKKNLKTFQRYLEIECWKRAEVRDLEKVLQAVAESCKQINRIVQRAQTDDLYGAAVGKDGEVLDANIQGEVQQQLDVLCNTIMLRAFCGSSRSIHSVASEEEDETRCCSDVMVRRVGVWGVAPFAKHFVRPLNSRRNFPAHSSIFAG